MLDKVIILLADTENYLLERRLEESAAVIHRVDCSRKSRRISTRLEGAIEDIEDLQGEVDSFLEGAE